MNRQKEFFLSTQFIFFLISFFAICLFGAIASENMAHYGEKREKAHLIQLTETARASLDAAKISMLKGERADTESKEYVYLKEKIEELHKHIPEAGFLYVMTLNEKGVVWLVDSEPAESEDAVLPGRVFDDASKELIEIFTKGDSFTEGPLADDWGVWVTGVAAIHHPETEKIIAILGVDISAEDWQKTIFSYKLIGYTLTGFFLFLFFIITIYSYRHALAQKKILQETERRINTEQEVKQLRELLPICSFCKNVRDDKGYWNRIDSYINEHFDTQLTHSICPECLKKHYPDIAKKKKY